MRASWIVLLTACEGGAPSAKPTPTVAVISDAPAIDAATVDATSIDAAPTELAVPPALLAAPAWIGRRWTLGAGMVSNPHTTYTLQREGAQALLTIDVREPTAFDTTSYKEPTVWQTTSSQRYLGTFTEKAGVISLTLASAQGEHVEWECKPTRVQVAAAKAVRGKTPGSVGCTGDEGRWVPRATKPMSILACEKLPRDEFKTWDTDWNRVGLAPSPGVEWLFVNDHCIIQGGGWRSVAADGSIAGIRERR